MEIKLGNDHVAIIDDEDHKKISDIKWFGFKDRNTVYALGWIKGEKKKQARMHRLIMDAPPNIQVDHINHNGLDNRKANLRLCTTAENTRNRKAAWGVSKYKGVTFCNTWKKWKVAIRVNGKRHNIGTFSNEIEAALAYNNAAARFHGEFACLNEIDEALAAYRSAGGTP